MNNNKYCDFDYLPESKVCEHAKWDYEKITLYCERLKWNKECPLVKRIVKEVNDD